MKKFLKTLIIFMVGLLGLAYATDYAVTKGLMKTGDNGEGGGGEGGYEEFSTWNAICSASIDANVIINGASDAYRHNNPFILDTILHTNCYNIGMSGATFHKQYVRYKTFEKYNKKPKCIIQNVNYTMFSISNKVDDRFLPYLPYLVETQYLTGKIIFDKYIPLYRYMNRDYFVKRGLKELFHIKHYPDARKKGYFGTEAMWNGAALAEKLSKDSLVAQQHPEAIKLFDSYLNHCRQNNIKVILVFSPKYYKATDFTKDKKEVTDIFHSFSEKYDIPFLDYSNYYLSYDTTYFFNAVHLNKKGAELFSTKLAHDIDSLGIMK